MDIKIRHFTKLVILAVILGVLWYFHVKANTYGLISDKSESKQNFLEQLKLHDARYVDLHAQVYRQEFSTKFRSRGLHWLPNQTDGNVEGKSLLGTQSGNSTGLTDDPDNDDCSDVHKQAMGDQCHFVNVTDDCQIDEGFLDYTYFVYCDFSSKLLPLGVVLLVIWWLFLFVGLAVTADDFFCPALSVMSDTMRLSHNMAICVTLLAFGNGAPDIFSAIAAIGNAKDGDAGLALGALLGAGVFVTTIVAGFIAIICPFDAMQRPFLRDIIFYLAAVFWTFAVLWDKVITKLEAIGFILLYILYVLVVVVGRYIYTRQRRGMPPEERNIQESSGRSIINPLDTVTNDESQPLLSNPDVISLTAVRDEGAFREFVRNINPIDSEGWSGMNLFKKAYEIFKSPLMFFLIITVPVVNYEDEKHHWNRHLYCIQCVLGPLFSVAATKVGFNMIGGTFPVWALTLILGIMLASIVFFTSRNEMQPKYHAAFAYLGFVVSVVWIYSVANEIVNILQTFGVVFNISNAILGLTLLAWGNSIGDLIADSVMARQGYPRMGISACFGGPLFNLLLGIGIPFTIATVKKGDYADHITAVSILYAVPGFLPVLTSVHCKQLTTLQYETALQITLEEVVLAGFLAVSLISSLIIVPLSKFRMSRPWGIYLIVLYIIFLVVAILTETKVIHAVIDTGS